MPTVEKPVVRRQVAADAVLTSTLWVTVRGGGDPVLEHREVDLPEGISHEAAATAQREFLASVAELDFVD